MIPQVPAGSESLGWAPGLFHSLLGTLRPESAPLPRPRAQTRPPPQLPHLSPLTPAPLCSAAPCPLTWSPVQKTNCCDSSVYLETIQVN